MRTELVELFCEGRLFPISSSRVDARLHAADLRRHARRDHNSSSVAPRHDRAREDGHREAATEAKRSKATLIAISEDVQFAISGGPSSSHGNIGRLPRGARKKLVNHDLRSLKMLVTATQAANDLLEAQASSEGDAQALKRACAGVHDKIGRARNHLRERNMFIDGLMKR